MLELERNAGLIDSKTPTERGKKKRDVPGQEKEEKKAIAIKNWRDVVQGDYKRQNRSQGERGGSVARNVKDGGGDKTGIRSTYCFDQGGERN